MLFLIKCWKLLSINVWVQMKTLEKLQAVNLNKLKSGITEIKKTESRYSR